MMLPGWKVFPVHGIESGRCTCGKYPCGKDNTNAGKHPRHSGWQAEATSDPSQLALWQAQWPTTNWGITPGAAQFVIDVDPRHGGDKWLAANRHRLPLTYEVETGGGGRHLYYTHNEPTPVRNSGSLLAPGIDVRGLGGYVVGAGSLHRLGVRYTVTDHRPPAVAPGWLLRALRPAPAVPRRAPTPIRLSSGLTTRRLDYDTINRHALARLPELLVRWLPDGHFAGCEYVARNPRRIDRHPGSFKINTHTGRWADWAADARGGDPISLAAYLGGTSQGQAAARLAAILGVG